MFYRLIKPLWGKKKVRDKDGEYVKNPDFVREIRGKDVLEGCFDTDLVKEKNEEGYNVYFFPNHPSENIYENGINYMSGKYVDVFDYVFVDMDLKDGVYKSKGEFLAKVEEFPVKPTMVVNSGNGVHVYWKMNDLQRETYLLLQFGLINYFKTDDSVWTVLQLMRVPASQNTKNPDEYKDVQVLDELSSGQDYKVSDLINYLKIEEKQQKKIESHIAKLEGRVEVDLGDDINIDELPDKFLKLMYKDDKVYQLFNNPTEYYGDRSGADMALANILYSKNINKKDALAVIANSKKGLSKGLHRFDYAATTVEKVYQDRTKNHFMTVGQKLKTKTKVFLPDPVNGPEFFDCLEGSWRRKQVLGLIAGSGVGKTSVALVIFKHMIENNPDNDDVFVFFSLEMPEEEIIERWIALVGEDSDLADRLYVIGNEDEEGEPRSIGLQQIVWYCEDIKKSTGKNIASVAVDHIGIINNVIDTRKKPTFGAKGELDGGWGDEKALSMPSLCKAVKPLAKMLDTFLIVLTQTTKSKGAGDTPIDKDGAFGTASYEWMMDYIITLWQPLMRVHKDTELRPLAWMYAKIRKKHKNDRITTHEQMLLNYDQEVGELRPLEGSERAEFDKMLPLANEARKAAERKEVNGYKNSPSIKKLKLLMSKEE